MPLYEYECASCHRRTEKIQKFSDPELTVCPHCGGPLHRTLTAPAVHFAGGGWYKDLYSSAKPAGGAGESKSGDAAASTGDKAGSGSSAPAESASKPAESAPAAATPTAPAKSGS